MTQMNLSLKQKQNHGHREYRHGCQGVGVGWGMEWEVGVSRCKLLYIEWLDNKILLYNTKNYIQYLMINHDEKEIFKKDVCVYIYIYIYA